MAQAQINNKLRKTMIAIDSELWPLENKENTSMRQRTIARETIMSILKNLSNEEFYDIMAEASKDI